MTGDRFDRAGEGPGGREPLGPDAVLLRGCARAEAADLLTSVEAVAAEAPFRHMTTPGGYRMSVAMTNCGTAGWLSARRGYRSEAAAPETGRPCTALPAGFATLAGPPAAEARFTGVGPAARLG